MKASQSVPFVEHGQGDTTVVLLHGLFGDPENWRTIIEDLSGEYRFIAPQFPIDQFANIRPADFQSIGQLTDFLKVFFDQLGLKRAVLVGNSLGGQVGIDFTLRYGQYVDRLVITGSAGLFENAISGGERPKVNREYIRQRALEIFYDPDFITEDLIDKIYAALSDRTYVRLLIRIARASRDLNVKNDLHRLKLPTLIVWGKQDQITPPFVAEEFKAGIENSQLVYIDNCGHSPPIERPSRFSDILREFLKSPAPVCPTGG